MIDLVLEAHGLEPLGIDHHLVPVEVGGAQARVLGPLDVRLEVGHRQAALVPDDAALLLQDFRVHEDQGVALLALLVPLRVDDDQPDRLADLGSGQSDARLVVHHLEHVGRELARLVRDLVDRLGHLSQLLVGELQDVSQGHQFL